MKTIIFSFILASLLGAASARTQDLDKREDPLDRRLAHPKLKRYLEISKNDSVLVAPWQQEKFQDPRLLWRDQAADQPDFPGFRLKDGGVLGEAKDAKLFRAALQKSLGRVDTAWTREYASELAPAYDIATAITMDGLGNVYVTGYSSNKPYGVDYFTIKYGAAGERVWTARYNGPGNGDDGAFAIAVDGAGNVYVTGRSWGSDASTEDYATIKYNAAGVAQWVARYNGPGNYIDAAYALGLDAAGNVYVTGYSAGSNLSVDYATIKYSAAGVEQWVARYNGPGNSSDFARALRVDSASGDVYVTGESWGSGTAYDYATLKYNSAGAEQWVARYNGPGNSSDFARALSVDPASGDVYVTGYSRGAGTAYDYATLKYNSAGAQQWVARYNGPGNFDDAAYALGVDVAGNVYVTGLSYGSGTSYDYATIKYNSAGAEQWVDRYNGPGNSSDYAYALGLDAAGNVYVTGYSWGSGTSHDYATIKYNSAGVRLWLERHNEPGNDSDYAQALAVDAAGNIGLAGASYRLDTDYDFLTVKYNSASLKQWSDRYNGPGNSRERPTAMAADAAGNVYVTGASFASRTGYDYATIKYNAAGIMEWSARYAGPGSSFDEPSDLAVDNFGNVYVTGSSGTIKYNKDGVQQWFDMQKGTALAVDAAGNVHVTGEIFGLSSQVDYATIKYNSAGVKQWIKYYNGPDNTSDYAAALAIDPAGNVYVTGTSYNARRGPDYATVKYNSAGVEQWVARYNGPADSSDFAFAIAVDNAGNVYVTGSSRGANLVYDYATIKYNSAGVKQWEARFNRTGTSSSSAYDLAVDAGGNVYVTGSSGTIKYNPIGALQWFKSGFGVDLALDVAGNVYVLGVGLIKYTPNGVQDWLLFAFGNSLAVDLAGNVYVITERIGQGWSVYNTTKYVQDPPITPPSGREVRIARRVTSPGRAVEVPIELAAQGNENAIGFSLNFDSATLSSPQAKVGKDAAAAALNVNSTQVGSGRLGMALALPAGQSFAAGAREIVVLTFTVKANTTADSTRIDFSDQPIAKDVADANGNALAPTTWKGGTVTIVHGLEADIAPRPNGDGKVTIADWVVVGRITAGLDSVQKNTREFQRVDCAPKASCGDGRLTISDWVQAGRYAAGLDSVINACGPMSTASAIASLANVNYPLAGSVAKTSGARVIRVLNPKLQPGQMHTVTIELAAQGDENAVGFSLGFDPAVVTFKNAILDSGASGATLHVNSGQAANGFLGIALALPAGQTFAAGTRQLAKVNFSVHPNASTASTPIEFKDQPISREVVDANGNVLLATWTAVLTAVHTRANEAPTSFELGANLPNPFNPSTVITYALPRAVDVKLEIFDLLGRRVRTLVDQRQPAGRYAITWDGRNEKGEVVTSGVYLYQLHAGNFVQTRRMALVR
ncbi:MAG: SBBP repeat-containing protein [candidate division KSB1 bacterium]|nr:SBBP repeat-containing protein [candidate division KSB1 bacterium]MDZ7369249.1 SBBP repeat-containing protein [candidate division KSB1 bacterium]